VRKHIARRIAALAEGAEKPSPLGVLVRILAGTDDPEVQRDVLRGMADALAGRRDVTAPAGWSAVHSRLRSSKDGEVRDRPLALSVLFGDRLAMAELKRVVEDDKVNTGARERALQTLLDKRVEGVPALLRKLLDDVALRRPALRGLAAWDEPTTPGVILK